jgi:photosystem II stability/assembly factor-like uncharacterized protein
MLPFRSLLLAAVALSLLATPARPDWIPLGPDGGTVMSLAVDPSRPSVLYAGTPSTGVFKSVDAGATWAWSGAGLEAERKTRGIFTLAVDPRHPGTVLAGVHDGLFQSRDAGATWSQVSPGQLQWVFAVLFDPQHDRVVYAGTLTGVFRSADGGAHWQRRGPAKQVSALAIDPARGFLYAGYQNNTVLRSVNGGASWVGGQGLPQGGHLAALAVDPLHPGVVLAGTGSGAYRSFDGGGTWRRAQGIPGPAVAFAVQRSKRQMYAAVVSNGIFFSTDGGAHWKICPGQPAGSAALTLAASPAAVYAGTMETTVGLGGVFRSADGGASWTLRTRGLSTLEIPSVALFAPDAAHLDVYAAAGLPGMLLSHNLGATWQLLDVGVIFQDIDDALVEPRGTGLPPRVYAANRTGAPAILHSDDGGATWQAPGPPPILPFFRLARDPRTPGALWAAGGKGVLHASDGLHWALALENVNLTMVDVVPDVRDPRTIWASGYERVGTLSPQPYTRAYRSTDGGATWERIDAGLPERGQADVVQNPFDPGTLYAATDAGLYRSTDEGASWSLVPELGEEKIGAVGFTPSAVWADVWGVGPYRSADGVTGWELHRAGLTSRNILRLVPDLHDPERLFAATLNGGVFVLDEP